MNVRPFHLLLFMTPGFGLSLWRSMGILDREIKPYEEYVRRGWRVTIATYDQPGTVPPLARGIDVAFCPHARLLFLAPWVLRRALRSADVVKIDQSEQAWWYLVAARVHRKPFLLRCGWLPGSFLETKDGLSWRLRWYRVFEGWAFRHADACQVATAEDRDWVITRYGVVPGRVHVRPNFIDTTLFRPLAIERQPRSVVFVGRLVPQKNLDLLVRACEEAGASKLTLVGEGPERERIERGAPARRLTVEFAGVRPQGELPSVIQASEVFALTSTVEGHPKALLEAMACGMPCVATRVPGNIAAVRDGATGILCDQAPASAAAALKRLFESADLRRQLGENARRYVEQELAFPKIFDGEFQLAEHLASGEHG